MNSDDTWQVGRLCVLSLPVAHRWWTTYYYNGKYVHFQIMYMKSSDTFSDLRKHSFPARLQTLDLLSRTQLNTLQRNTRTYQMGLLTRETDKHFVTLMENTLLMGFKVDWKQPFSERRSIAINFSTQLSTFFTNLNEFGLFPTNIILLLVWFRVGFELIILVYMMYWYSKQYPRKICFPLVVQ